MYILGYGASNGKPVPSRSEKVMEKNGAGDVVKFVMKQFNIQKPSLYGYDWGGCIALKLGVFNSQMFSFIMASHPSYNEEKPDELKNLKNPTLI